MKKLVMFILSLSLVLGLFAGTTAFADTTTSKLNANEMKMVQAYAQSMVTGSAAYMNKYAFPGRTFKDTPISGDVTVTIVNPVYYKVTSSKTKVATLFIDGYTVITDVDATQFSIYRISSGMDLKVKGKKTYLYAKNKATISEAIQFGQVAEADAADVKAYLESVGFPNTSTLAKLSASYNEVATYYNEINKACQENGLYTSNADVAKALDSAVLALDSLNEMISSGKLTADQIDFYSISIYHDIVPALDQIRELY